MDITIYPTQLQGNVCVFPSKSQAHRFLICAAFANNETTLICPEINRDIEATVHCLRALGADIQRTPSGYNIDPVQTLPESAELNCGESGSTLRFLLPIVGALGIDTTIHMEGRLPQRPLSPLWEEMERMGCSLSRSQSGSVRCQGRLRGGDYRIDGSVSSQFITGLMLALCLIGEPSHLDITGQIQSRPYITLTQNAITRFGGRPGGRGFHTPGTIQVEGDWSSGAFWLTAKALGNPIAVTGLNKHSSQGDRAVSSLLSRMKTMVTIPAGDIPDLVPILSIFAAANNGAIFTDTQRLRLKESDRVSSTIAMIEALGGKAEATENILTVYGTGLTGGIVDSQNDHRIAMSAAIGATACSKPVTILGIECAGKSYPKFFEEYRRLGGNYEQYLR